MVFDRTGFVVGGWANLGWFDFCVFGPAAVRFAMGTPRFTLPTKPGLVFGAAAAFFTGSTWVRFEGTAAEYRGFRWTTDGVAGTPLVNVADELGPRLNTAE